MPNNDKNNSVWNSIGLVSVFGLAVLTGCTTYKPPTNCSAEESWADMRLKAQVAEVIPGVPLVNELPFAGIAAKQARESITTANERAEVAARNAATPRAAMVEIAAKVSKHLVDALPAYAQKQGSEWKLTLALGSLTNTSGDSKLDDLLGLIGDRLQEDPTFQQHFDLLVSTETDATAVLDDLAGSGHDVLWDPEGLDQGVRQVYSGDLFLLTGNLVVDKSADNQEITTVTTIRVEHPKSRGQVLSQEFQQKYVFHPGFMKFITQETDDARRGGTATN